MTPTHCLRRGQFRLLDLLALTTAVALTFAVMPCCIGESLDKSRGGECTYNARNIALSALIYDLTKRRFPGYSNFLKLSNGQCYSDPATGKPRGVGYIIPLLPYLDHPELDKAWKQPTSAGEQRADLRVRVRELRCPSDPTKDTQPCPLSYVVNCGMADVAGLAGTPDKPGVPRDWAANGVFFDLFTGNQLLTGGKAPKVSDAFRDDFGVFDYTQPGLPLVGMSAEYIKRTDGLGTTCLLSENVDTGQYTDETEATVGIVWDANGKIDVSQDPPHLKPPSASMMINVESGKSGGRPGTAFARPSSFHSGGVNMAFCDGKVRFVSDEMDYYVYCLLMSSNGSKVKLPGSTQVLPNFDRPVNEAWYTQ